MQSRQGRAYVQSLRVVSAALLLGVAAFPGQAEAQLLGGEREGEGYERSEEAFEEGARREEGGITGSLGERRGLEEREGIVGGEREDLGEEREDD